MTPEGWREVGIFDVADIVSSQVDPQDLPYRDWPLVAPNHIEEGTGRLLPVSSAGEQSAISGKYTFAPGDVIYSKIRPYLRKVALPQFHGLCSADMYPLRPRKETVPGFLFAILLGQQFTDFATSVSMRTGIPKINRDEMAQFRFALPPLAEQREIAAILSSVDEAIEATQAVIDQLQVVKRAMIAGLLTCGLPGKHTSLRVTDFGDVPSAWSVLPLSEVAEVQTGIAKGKLIERGVEVPYLRVADVQDGYLDLRGVKSITVDARMLDRYRLRPGDVLFTEGGDADKLGRGCVWSGQIETCLHQNHVFAVRTDPRRLLPPFLALAAASPKGKAYFLDCAKQTTNLASINSTQLKQFPVPLPPSEEQEAIVNAVAAVENRLFIEADTLVAMSKLKMCLSAALLTGEIRVTPTSESA
jgi:type I restriction enzyme, S subunit